MNIVRINQKNQVNIPKEIAENINFGPERYVQVIADRRDNSIRIIPVTPEPVYSKTALEGLDRLIEKEKKGVKEVRGTDQIQKFFHNE